MCISQHKKNPLHLADRLKGCRVGMQCSDSCGSERWTSRALTLENAHSFAIIILWLIGKKLQIPDWNTSARADLKKKNYMYSLQFYFPLKWPLLLSVYFAGWDCQEVITAEFLVLFHLADQHSDNFLAVYSCKASSCNVIPFSFSKTAESESKFL